MKAMVVTEFRTQPELTEVPTPEPQADEVLVRIQAAGVCHTDMKIRDGLVPDVPLPLVLGHEIAGVVEAVGSDVSRVRVGDRGVPYGYVTCGRCRFCIDGRTSLCSQVRLRYGFGQVGGYSQFLTVPEQFFMPVGASTPADKAAVASCSVVTSYRALVKRAKVRQGEVVVVVGAGGGVGLQAVQIAAHAGARVIAVDTDERRFPLATEQGAHETMLASEDGFAEGVLDLTQGQGAAVVVDLVATASTMAASLAALESGGRLVLVGYRPDVPFTAVVPDVVFREIEVYGSHWASLTDMREVLAMIDEGLLNPLVMRSYPLEEAARALEELATGEAMGRTVLTP